MAERSAVPARNRFGKALLWGISVCAHRNASRQVPFIVERSARSARRVSSATFYGLNALFALNEHFAGPVQRVSWRGRGQETGSSLCHVRSTASCWALDASGWARCTTHKPGPKSGAGRAAPRGESC